MSKEKVKGQPVLKKAMTYAEDKVIPIEEKPAVDSSVPEGTKVGEKKDGTMHQLILSEFKVKYDQLQSQYQQKKKEADSLLYKNKKLEVELLNLNVDYYEKEIVRLRQDVQKYQTENEDHKHKFFLAQNSKKQLEAISRVKQEELKQVLKQLEKEKIIVVETRHQMSEKDKNFSQVLKQLQNSNQIISSKYDQVNTKLGKAESDIKIKNIEIEQLKRQLERKEKELASKKDQCDKEKEKHELEEFRWKHRLDDLEEEIRDYKAKENEKIKSLDAKVKELAQRCASEELLLAEKNEAANKIKQIRDKEVVIAGLEEQTRELMSIIEGKDNEIGALKNKLQGVCPMGLLEESQDRYVQMINKSKNTEKMLENKVAALEKDLAMARIIKEGQSGGVKLSQNFQDLLKGQIEENSRLKNEMTFKIQEIYSLKNRFEQQQIKMSLLQNQIDILKKRARTVEKNSKIEFEIEIQNLRNDIETLRRKLEVTETKLSIKAKEVKDKDSFISSVVIGRSRQEDVPFVIAELKRVFDADYAGKLSEANLRIIDLQGKLQSR